MSVYMATTAIIAGTGSAANIISIENPSDSMVVLRLLRAYARGVPQGLAITSAFLYMVQRTDGLPSGGTTLDVCKTTTADADPVALVRAAPAGSVVPGTAWADSPGGVVTMAGFAPPGPTSEPFPTPDSYSINLLPGEGCLIKTSGSTLNWKHWGHICWVEG